MELNTDFTKTVFIVSIFGRGNWLAMACKKLGLNVTLIDLSSAMGNWGAEDAEGPFGFLKDEKLDESVVNRIQSSEAFESLDSGFTILLPDGPVQFKSPLTMHRLEQIGIPKRVIEGLGKNESVSTLADRYNFSEAWPLHLACEFSSTKWSPSALSAKRTMPAPLLSNFFVKNATRVGLESSLDWVRGFGVEVSTSTEILDVSFSDSKTIAGLELKGELSGLKKCDRMIWCLTSEESYYYSERLGSKIWQNTKNESAWCWIRYQLKFNESPQFQTLPIHFVKVADLYSPWTHENFLIAQKTKSSGIVDIWSRIPTVQRFNKDYLGQLGEKIKQGFVKQLSLFTSDISHYPQEYTYTYAQLGPNRHPVYDLPIEKGPNYKNLGWSHPEVWDSFSWSARARYEKNLLSGIEQWWTDLRVKEAKRVAKLNKTKSNSKENEL